MAKLQVFDFDETLFRVPSYVCKEATGLTPYEWFDSEKSLDQSFNIKGIENVILRTRDTAAINILITHRVVETRDAVIDVLSSKNIRFDKLYFLGRSGKKVDVLISRLREDDEIDELVIYEDSLYQIIEYTSGLRDYGFVENVKFVFVDKNKIIEFDMTTAREIEDYSNITRLNII
jgi:hypothetical protein